MRDVLIVFVVHGTAARVAGLVPAPLPPPSAPHPPQCPRALRLKGPHWSRSQASSTR